MFPDTSRWGRSVQHSHRSWFVNNHYSPLALHQDSGSANRILSYSDLRNMCLNPLPEAKNSCLIYFHRESDEELMSSRFLAQRENLCMYENIYLSMLLWLLVLMKITSWHIFYVYLVHFYSLTWLTSLCNFNKPTSEKAHQNPAVVLFFYFFLPLHAALILLLLLISVERVVNLQICLCHKAFSLRIFILFHVLIHIQMSFSS